MSMIFIALLLCFGKALDRLYTSLINLTHLFALYAESRHTLLCTFNLFLCFSLLLLYWTHCFANTFLCSPMFVYDALMFWPRFYNNLFGAHSTGCSFLTILFDPKGSGLSNWPCLWNAISQANCICPIWSNSMSSHPTRFMERFLTFINLLVTTCLWRYRKLQDFLSQGFGTLFVLPLHIIASARRSSSLLTVAWHIWLQFYYLLLFTPPLLPEECCT